MTTIYKKDRNIIGEKFWQSKSLTRKNRSPAVPGSGDQSKLDSLKLKYDSFPTIT